MAVVTAAMASIGFFIPAPVWQEVLVACVVLGAAYSIAIYSRINVVADDRAFVVRSPLFPLALKVIPLTEILAAEEGSIRPLKFGGWGYRICGRGCRAIVIRKGVGIRLSLPREKTFIVTVSDAGAGARWVSDHIAP